MKSEGSTGFTREPFCISQQRIRLPVACYGRTDTDMENFVLIGLFVLLGMVFRRLNTFPKDAAQVLNTFALHVSLPEYCCWWSPGEYIIFRCADGPDIFSVQPVSLC
jgi:hypothetical protein